MIFFFHWNEPFSEKDIFESKIHKIFAQTMHFNEKFYVVEKTSSIWKQK